MKYRGFRYNGQVPDWWFATEDEFTVPVESHIADLAAALGAAPSTIEAFESEAQPVPTMTVTPTPPVVDAALNAIVAVLTKPDADVTAAELKSVTLSALRRLRNRRAL